MIKILFLNLFLFITFINSTDLCKDFIKLKINENQIKNYYKFNNLTLFLSWDDSFLYLQIDTTQEDAWQYSFQDPINININEYKIKFKNNNCLSVTHRNDELLIPLQYEILNKINDCKRVADKVISIIIPRLLPIRDYHKS